MANKMIFEEKVLGQDISTFLFTCSSDDWDGHLSILGNPREPVPMSRRHYICERLSYDWKAKTPDGCQVLPLGTILLREGNLQIPSEVKTTLGKWKSIKDDRFQDFGFVAVQGSQVTSWATVDFVTANSGDLGFETLPEFRRRELGSVVATAALEHGLEIGIETHWTCSEDNIASLKTAEKLGLMHERDYTIYLFMLNEYDHLGQLAYSNLLRSQYREAIEIYEKIFAQKTDIPTWAYFDTAQAWAALGDGENAIKYLRLAAKDGWTAVELVEQTKEFKFLKEIPQWDDVIERMQQNKK